MSVEHCSGNLDVQRDDDDDSGDDDSDDDDDDSETKTFPTEVSVRNHPM
jgi:hypothetical protein